MVHGNHSVGDCPAVCRSAAPCKYQTHIHLEKQEEKNSNSEEKRQHKVKCDVVMFVTFGQQPQEVRYTYIYYKYRSTRQVIYKSGVRH